jgi:3',5'-cyclic AMP phosphodiesterase CpdA
MRSAIKVVALLFLFSCIFPGALASEPATDSLKTTNAANDTVKFVVFSDSHIGLNETNNTYKMFHYSQKIVSDMINEVGKMDDVDFILIVGDLTKDSEPENHEWFLEELSNLRMPYYMTPGNHDVKKKGMPEENWGSAEMTKNYPMPWRNDSLSYSLDVAPRLHLVSLDSSSDQSHFGDWGGATSKEDLEWLEQDLANNTGKTTLVMTHNALNYHEGVDDRLYYNDNSTQIKQILNKYGVRLAITGHIHASDIAKNDSLFDVSVPSTSTYPLSYTVWQISGSQAEIQTVRYKNQTIMNIAKQEFIDAGKNVTQAEGTPSDRDAAIDMSA